MQRLPRYFSSDSTNSRTGNSRLLFLVKAGMSGRAREGEQIEL